MDRQFLKDIFLETTKHLVPFGEVLSFNAFKVLSLSTSVQEGPIFLFDGGTVLLEVEILREVVGEHYDPSDDAEGESVLVVDGDMETE